jgi:predicted GNAT family acetyltransferase
MPLMALVRDENEEIRASALMTPPFPLIAQSEPLHEPALEALADFLILKGFHLPGVNGVDEASDCFAEIWQERTGQLARRIMNTRAYELRHVLAVDYPTGEMKIAEEADARIAAEMHNAMVEEVILGPRSVYTAEMALESIQQKCTFFWMDGGEVVSACIAMRPQIRGICIGAVYTPPALRRKGYARALVAEVSKELLSRGYEFTNLFTDLSNPTSNKIYQEVGYKPVADYHQYELVDQA